MDWPCGLRLASRLIIAWAMLSTIVPVGACAPGVPTTAPTSSPTPTATAQPTITCTVQPSRTRTATSTATLEPTNTRTTPPTATATRRPTPLLGVMHQGGQLGRVWNLADLHFAVLPDRVRIVLEMVEDRDHVPFHRVVEVDNSASPFPTGHDPAWGVARIDIQVSDLYAYGSSVFAELPLVLSGNPAVTRIGQYPTFEDSILGFSIGLKAVATYQVVELTEPVRIVLEVFW
jgi:hypothetical protein